MWFQKIPEGFAWELKLQKWNSASMWKFRPVVHNSIGKCDSDHLKSEEVSSSQRTSHWASTSSMHWRWNYQLYQEMVLHFSVELILSSFTTSCPHSHPFISILLRVRGLLLSRLPATRGSWTVSLLPGGSVAQILNSRLLHHQHECCPRPCPSLPRQDQFLSEGRMLDGFEKEDSWKLTQYFVFRRLSQTSYSPTVADNVLIIAYTGA